MKKMIILLVAVFLLVGLTVGGYFYWKKHKALTSEEAAIKKAGEAVDIIKKSASEGVLPSFDLGTNPLENKPDINPVDKINPFKGIETNPFK
jgi:hypothetical protein